MMVESVGMIKMTNGNNDEARMTNLILWLFVIAISRFIFSVPPNLRENQMQFARLQPKSASFRF